MSIATDITGGAASNQLLDLLSLVANPAVYEAKVKALQDATEENRKFVEAVGPASEILKLREQAAAMRDEADKYRQDAFSDGDAQLKKAQAQAAAIVAEAQAKADVLMGQVQSELADAKAARAAVEQLRASADSAQKAAAASIEAANQREAAAKAAQDAADAAKTDAEAIKADILAKHKAFIESL